MSHQRNINSYVKDFFFNQPFLYILRQCMTLLKIDSCRVFQKNSIKSIHWLLIIINKNNIILRSHESIIHKQIEALLVIITKTIIIIINMIIIIIITIIFIRTTSTLQLLGCCSVVNSNNWRTSTIQLVVNHAKSCYYNKTSIMEL